MTPEPSLAQLILGCRPDRRRAVATAGAAVPRMGRPAGLTDREAQVISMVAKGLQTKQVGHRLGISAKSADRHLQNAYAKMGVSTRAAAALLPSSTASPPRETRYRLWASVPSVDLRRTAVERVPKPGGRHGSQP